MSSAGATGLLAPILLGLPIGVALQFLVRHTVSTGAEGNLEPWVFALVYTGFGLLGIALAALLGLYVLDRWHRLVAAPPPKPSTWVLVLGALGLLPFGVAMLWWGLAGAGTVGPQGMDSLEQRVFLLVTGSLAILGFGAPLVSATDRPRLAWLVTWVGCTVTALQGPTQLLLARGGDPQPLVALITLAATPGSCAYGLAFLRARRNSIAD